MRLPRPRWSCWPWWPGRTWNPPRAPTGATGGGGSPGRRSLVLHEHDDLLRAARADWATDPELREDYRHHRPNIERVVSQVASQGGQRVKLRYLGTIKNHAW